MLHVGGRLAAPHETRQITGESAHPAAPCLRHDTYQETIDHQGNPCRKMATIRRVTRAVGETTLGKAADAYLTTLSGAAQATATSHRINRITTPLPRPAPR